MIDTSPTALLRAGSGLLLALVGVAIVVLGRRMRANAGLGLWVVGVGSTTITSQLFFKDAATAVLGLTLTGIAYALTIVGPALWLLASRARRHLPAAAAFGLVFATGFLMPVQRLLPPTASGSSELRAVVGILGALAGVMAAITVVAIALAARAAVDGEERRRSALVAVVIGTSWAFTAGAAFTGPIPFERAGIIYLVGAPSAWLWAAARAGRPAVAVAWSLLGVGALAMADDVWFGGSTILGTSLVTVLIRGAQAGLLVYGIVRLRLLGHELAAPTARRGTLATAALVGFFVVAQIAQEFLSDTMGVVLGGVAAGALLFAAVPLQRAAERLAAGGRAARPADDAHEETYRAALRLALHDGAMTAEEEHHLATLADRLGVSYAVALRLRREVEGDLADRAR